ncbi:MAG: bifunctional proline dehydrogenase/L-glutamate gamma-semialdehyde dehydrogenase [Parachlamydiaceae bacterium]
MSFASKLDDAKAILLKCKDKPLSLEEKIQHASALAACLIEISQQISDGTHFYKEMGQMVKDAKGKVLVTEIADQIFRSQSNKRIADQLNFLFRRHEIPQFLTGYKRWGLSVFKNSYRRIQQLLVPLIQQMIRKESQRVILPGEDQELHRHLAKRREEGVNINLNRIGEAILGEDEALRRLNIYLKDLANPEITYISVKISSIFSQINLIAWQENVDILKERLRDLYRTAGQHFYDAPNGEHTPKFVNLDMEEYRDLQLTKTIFKEVLEEPEFLTTSAGIVLQSYLPDSYSILQELTEWAIDRVNQGGAPIKIRLVKGANLALERVEAALKDWPQAPYLTKEETDANFISMINYALVPEHAKAVRIGVGSHNILDIAYSLVLSVSYSLEDFVGCEMLEGMAEAMAKTIQMVTGSILLYAPAVKKEQFQNAISYLVRRLDENTAKENFLSHFFDLKLGSAEWQEQVSRFVQSCYDEKNVSHEPRRTQDRRKMDFPKITDFRNEPDTDWSLIHHHDWVYEYMERWRSIEGIRVPLVINGQELYHENRIVRGVDPSNPNRSPFEYSLADSNDIDTSLNTGLWAFKDWQKTSTSDRALILARIAQKIREKRGHLIGAMAASTGKAIIEADTEISEAIDFAEYYLRSMNEFHLLEDIKWHAKGVILIAPPWNFSVAIPAGGILAALAGGNTVIFKPAPEAVLVGYELVKLFWEAGVSQQILQFINCADDPEGSLLIQDKRISSVVLTGATATAELFLKLRPDLDLMAETGGKNAIIVTALADRDLAIKDIVQSAFGYSGQKCSACSLLILEKEVYHDPLFREALKDAAKSFKVGSPFNYSSKVTPLIKPPEKPLYRGLTTLDDGEYWLLQPQQDPTNVHLWSPGIKWGVKEGSFMHQTELFGPVLGVLCAENLDHAIKIANATRYGLTSGLHSLDVREQLYWSTKIEAGNCYINRGITGAIVERQPFGGYKDSSFGRGIKAGGPNYVQQFMIPEQSKDPTHLEPLSAEWRIWVDSLGLNAEDERDLKSALGSYLYFYKHYFSKSHDPLKILGQDNLLQYRSHDLIFLRIGDNESVSEILKVVAACQITMTPLEISTFKPIPVLDKLRMPIAIIETDAAFTKRLEDVSFPRLRLLRVPKESLYSRFADLACRMHVGPVLSNGRLELLNYLREVAFSVDYHRYGYLGLREKSLGKKGSCESQCSPSACCS